MRVTAVAVAVLAALVLAAPAVSAQPEIERVVVSRSADGILTFRIEFTGPVVLGEDTRLRVAIDTDRDPTTGNNGIDYALDWTGRFPGLLEAFAGNEREASSSSLDMTHEGAVVTFSVAASDLFDLSQFDFYVFAELGGDLGDRTSTEIPFSAGESTSTYPRDDTPVPEGEPYPVETYEEAGEAFPDAPSATPGRPVDSQATPPAEVQAATETTAPSDAPRPDIDQVVVSRGADGTLTFRIEFAEPVVLDDETTVQVAIDGDRNGATGVNGLEYSLDWTGYASLLTAVEGSPSESSPASLEFADEGDVVTFRISASDLGDLDRFDFYAFIRQGDVLDEAPSHVLFSAGAAPWTYPSGDVPAAGEPYPTETFDDLGDFTLSERGWTFVLAIVGGLLGLGAIAGVTGWSVERRRRRRGAPPPSPA
jgi:hypothetical protein